MFNYKSQLTSNFLKAERVDIKNCCPLIVCLRLQSLETTNYHTLIYLSIIIIFLNSFTKRCLQCLLDQYWPENCTSFSLLFANTNNRTFFNVSLNQINNNTKNIFVLNTSLLSSVVLMKKYCITSS